MRRFLALALLLSSCTIPGRQAAPAARPSGTGTIVRPVDGDTVVVNLDGVEERVRLIGIDTPESVDPNRPVECYGPEAKERAAALLPIGTVVRLERDVEARDKYGRLLAYVYRAQDDVLVNLVLVQEGYAESFPYPPNTALQGELDRAEAEARAGGRGLWPSCGSTDVPIGPAPG